MKKNDHPVFKVKILFIIPLFIFTTLGINAQTYFLTGQTPPSAMFQTGTSSTNFKVGVGINPPYAKLHIWDNNGTYPVFRAELDNSTSWVGIIDQLFYDTRGQLYGIYQTSSVGLLNYFQDNIITGANTIWTDVPSNTAGIDARAISFSFSLSRSSPGGFVKKSPFILFPDSVQSTYKLITNTFRLIAGSGDGKVLASDAIGNGIWKNVNEVYDYWLPVGGNGNGKIAEQNLILNPKYQRVGIGTFTPQSQLAVNGKITAKEVEVALDGFPDSVFTENYNLKPLNEIEEYVKTNKHLPEIPSEKDVREQGLELGKMNSLLLKKVEELTLYVISLKKEIEQLKSGNPSKK